MNPANPDFSNRTASSPALFNRCVVDWFGDWSDFGMEKVAEALIKDVEIPDESFVRQNTGKNQRT
jgi:dynein heavy chain 1, cytosolic